MKVNLGARRRARIEILPLIDIVFLLLVFFIYAMLSMAVHRGISVNLPLSSSAHIQKESMLPVTIKHSGELFLEKERVSLHDLVGLLRLKVKKGTVQGVLLFADKEVSCQNLVTVLDHIRMAGITTISLQTEMERTP